MDVKYIFILSLLLYPLLGLFLGYLTRDYTRLRRGIIFSILVVAIIAIVAGIFGVSTIYTGVDFILYSSFYLSLSFGLWYIYFKKSRVLAALIMLAIYFVGFIFSLALPLAGDIAPKTVIRLDDHYIYKEMAVDSEYAGKQVEVFKVYNNFFEKRIVNIIYYDDAPAFVTDTLALDYQPQKHKLYLSIPQDEEKYMYTFHEKFNVNWVDSLDLKD